MGPSLNCVCNCFHYGPKTETNSCPRFTWHSQSKKLDSPAPASFLYFPALVRLCSPGLLATALGSALSQNWACTSCNHKWGSAAETLAQVLHNLSPAPSLQSILAHCPSSAAVQPCTALLWTSHHSLKVMPIFAFLCPSSMQLLSPDMPEYW